MLKTRFLAAIIGHLPIIFLFYYLHGHFMYFVMYVFSMNKVLFLDPVETYVGKDNWPPENDRG